MSADGLALCVTERADCARIAIILRHAGGEVFYDLHPDRAENPAEGPLDPGGADARAEWRHDRQDGGVADGGLDPDADRRSQL